MTENEAIKELETSIELAEMCTPNREREKEIKAYKMAIQALAEIQQYRAIGTVEELQKAKEQYDGIHSVAKKTALCGLCDYATAKEAVITEMKRSLDCSLKEYQSIGTIEEFKALKEKNEPIKPVKIKMASKYGSKAYICARCNELIGWKQKHCNSCGSEFDWQ